MGLRSDRLELGASIGSGQALRPWLKARVAEILNRPLPAVGLSDGPGSAMGSLLGGWSVPCKWQGLVVSLQS